jgi:predicted MFS family arabinose efflux permease
MAASDKPAGTHASHPLARMFAWVSHPQTPNAILFTLVLICAGLAAFDFLRERHVIFKFEEMKAFYGLFGFAAFVAIVQAARLLRLIVKRDERYYDR